MAEADRLTKLLANPQWRPTRVDIECARNALVDLMAAKMMKLPDEQVRLMFASDDEADRAAEHAGYVMRIAIQHYEIIEAVRSYAREQQAWLDAMTDRGADDQAFCKAQGRVEAANQAYMLVAPLASPPPHPIPTPNAAGADSDAS